MTLPNVTIKSPYEQAYNYLIREFAPIEKILYKLEDRTELDGLIDNLAKHWVELSEKNVDDQLKMLNATIHITKELCAKAICSLCEAEIPLYEVKGRLIHREKTIPPSLTIIDVRCAATPIWQLGTSSLVQPSRLYLPLGPKKKELKIGNHHEKETRG